MKLKTHVYLPCSLYEDVTKISRTESITKQTTTNTCSEATQKVTAAKFTRLAHRTAPRVRELYHLLFSLQATSPETFGYTEYVLENDMKEDFCFARLLMV
jgi:hypothetical protein